MQKKRLQVNSVPRDLEIRIPGVQKEKDENRLSQRIAELLSTSYETPRTRPQTRKCRLGTQNSPTNGRAFKLLHTGTVIRRIK